MTFYTTMTELVDTIHAADNIPFLHADSGAGKTSFIHNLTRRDTVTFGDDQPRAVGGVIRLLPGSMEPGDLLGLPYLGGDDEKQTCFSTPAWAVRANNLAAGGNVVYIFIEEATRARADVLDLLHVIYETRTLPGGYHLAPTVRFILAGNDPEHDPTVRRLTPAMNSRLVHIDFDPDIESWTDGLITNFGQPATGHYTAWATIIAAYLRAHPAHVTTPLDGDRTRGWANRRTWTRLGHVLGQYGEPDHTDDTAFTLARGVVGDLAAEGLFGYMRETSLPTSAEVVDDPTVVNTLSPDEVWAVLSRLGVDAAEAETADETHDPKSSAYLRTIGVLNVLAPHHPDIAAGVLLSFIDHATELYGTRAVSEVAGSAYGDALAMLASALED